MKKNNPNKKDHKVLDNIFKTHPELEHKINVFLAKCKSEGNEYSEAFELIQKGFSGKKLTKAEHKKIWDQMIDTLKISGNIVLFLIPFGSLLLPLLLVVAKKYHVDILPSSFKDETKKELPNET